jgi:transposase InsO family protein
VSVYQHIAQRRQQAPVRQLCRVLRVAPSAYYAGQQRHQVAALEPAWQAAVRAAFQRHGRRYGTRRLRAELQAEGHGVGRGRIRRTLATHGLRAEQPRSFVPRTTDSDPTGWAAPNRLLGQPAPTAPNRVWVGDITYLPKQGGGWLYLATWLDRCSRKVVGWEVREAMPEALVSDALRRALAVRQPAAGLIVHSDQGSQYSATRFKDLLARHGALPSRSRLKTERLDGGRFPGLEEAWLEISHYIAYYNAERRHSALGYLAPNHFESHLQTTSQLCPA